MEMQSIVNAPTYVHTSFSKSVIHREIRSAIIILDENNVAKLIDSRSYLFLKVNCMYSRPYVREWGVVHLNILLTGYITEKVDVYIYGVLLLGLLAGWMLNTQYRLP